MHHKCIFSSAKMKANHNFTPPLLLPLTNPLCMVVCQPPLLGLGEHYFLIKYAEEVSASLGCIRSLYSTNLANYATLQRARTQKTQKHTTTNMSRRRPTHQLGWESRRHVGDMSPRQPNVVTFGRNAPVAPTQFWSRHIFLCRDLPTSTKFSTLVP